MLALLRPLARRILLACFYLAASIGVEVLAVRQTARAVDQIRTMEFVGPPRVAGFWAWLAGTEPATVSMRHIVLVLAGFMVLTGVLIYLRDLARTRMCMGLVEHLRGAAYDKLQRVGFGFHDAVSTGELINRSLSDLHNVRQFITSAVLICLEILLILAGYFTVLATRSPSVAMLALVPLPFWTWYLLWFGKRMQPVVMEVMATGDENTSILTENISGVRVVKAFGAERYETARFDANCDRFFDGVMRRLRMFANFAPTVRSISVASHLMMFCAAGILIMKRQLNAGDVLVLGAAMGAILGRLHQVATMNDQYQNAIVSARRLHEVLSAPPTVQVPRTPRAVCARGSIRFEGVCFGYGETVLRDVSFEVGGGSHVAIVGPTGAGKSTLVNLLARFYDPQRGRILIDGVDLRDVDLSTLRRQVAYVFQDTYLFSDTVEANIAYGRPGTDRRQVERAARLAQAHDFIVALPHGYHTVLAEGGASLSGGQRQRLAIARALVTDPGILILDDAAASLDAATEERLQGCLAEVIATRTVFTITHRVSTIRRAHQVLVLKNGKLIQAGTHEQLVDVPGHYRELVEMQLVDDSDRRESPPSWTPAGEGGVIVRGGGRHAGNTPRRRTEAAQGVKTLP